jgi:DNA-binding NtrC family response regulator
MNPDRLLIVDDEESVRRVLQVQLQRQGYSVDIASNATEALAALASTDYPLVLSDLRMPGLSGMELLKQIKASHPATEVILLTAFGTVENAVEAMQAGAYHYVTKPVRYDELFIVISRALERWRLLREITALRESLDHREGFAGIIGHSKALLAVLDIASRAAQSSSTVLIEGESGTGKELLARAIHANSPRSKKPFVAINCGAIPRDLLESELFGYKRGAFTGATADKTGRVEAAQDGTLFLDEVGEMPLDLQVKILRLIQEGEIQKLGSVEPTRIDVRIVAATNRSLLRMVEDGEFREDLYYRLAVIPMTLPPLRERAEDLPDLVGHLWRSATAKHGRPQLTLPESLLPYFSRYGWPGNIRELQNVIERIVVLSRGLILTLDDLPEMLRRERPILDSIQLELPPTPISLEAVERELILRALERYDWNQTKAAQYLGLTRKTLIYRMDRHALRKPDM